MNRKLFITLVIIYTLICGFSLVYETTFTGAAESVKMAEKLALPVHK